MFWNDVPGPIAPSAPITNLLPDNLAQGRDPLKRTIGFNFEGVRVMKGRFRVVVIIIWVVIKMMVPFGVP